MLSRREKSGRTLDKSRTGTYRASVRAARTTAARTDPAFRGWLRELRQRAGLTQEELATAVGTDRRNIRRWEVDGHDPSGTVLLELLSALGIELVPVPPAGVPRAITAELTDLRRQLHALSDSLAGQHDALAARLDAQDAELRVLTSRLAEMSSQSE